MPFYDAKGKAIIPVSKPKESTTIAPVVQDFKQGITPVERTIINKAPTTKTSYIGSKPTTTKTSYYTLKPTTKTSYASPLTQTPQIIKDVGSSITPYERQIIEQGPTREEVKQVEASKLTFVKSVTGHGEENIPERILVALDKHSSEQISHQDGSINLPQDLLPRVDYWEIDPDWDGGIFNSQFQAVRPWRKGDIVNSIILPPDTGQICVRIVLINGEQIQQVL